VNVATILIVDDEPLNRLLLTTILKHGGYETVEAADADSGLAQLERHRADLAVVDLSLPGTSGTELIRRIRRTRDAAELPLLLYTASEIDPATRDFMDAYGVAGAIPKPCDPEVVEAAIEAALRRP